MLLYSILIVIQVLLSAGLITLVLLQHGKGADAGATFGSGASSTVFGSRGSANFFSRATAVIATLFFVNCIALAYLASHQESTDNSVMDRLNGGSSAIEQPIETPPTDVPGGGDASRPADVPVDQGSGRTSDVPE